MNSNPKSRSGAENQAHALMVTCSSSALHTMFANLLDPVYIFQNLGGTLPASAGDSGWGTVDYAIEQLGLRQILLCGHSHCYAPRMEPVSSQIDAPAARTNGAAHSAAKLTLYDETIRSQRWLTEQMKRLSSFLDRSVHRAEITLHALWFNDDRGTLFIWSSTSERFEPADHLQIRRLLDLLSMSSERTEEVLRQVEEFPRLLLSDGN
jgi:carbonic anhydrase